MMMSRRAVLLALASAACARRSSYVITRASRGTSVPLGFVGTLPTVPVEVSGQTVDVLLDLGGFDTLSLSPALARRLGARPTGRTRTFRNARGAALETRELELPDVRFGDMVLHGVRGYEHVFAPDFPPPVEAGYIGRGILDRIALVIDYPARQLVIPGPGADLPAEGWRTTRIISADVGAVVSATVDGRDYTLLLDTGATSSFLRDAYSARDLRIGGVALGPLDFDALELSVPGVDGFLGANFFAARRVLVSFPVGIVGV
jgi:Aspartyl protease